MGCLYSSWLVLSKGKKMLITLVSIVQDKYKSVSGQVFVNSDEYNIGSDVYQTEWSVDQMALWKCMRHSGFCPTEIRHLLYMGDVKFEDFQCIPVFPLYENLLEPFWPLC